MKFVIRATVAATLLSALTLFALCTPPAAAQSDKIKVTKGKPPVIGPVFNGGNLPKPRPLPESIYNPLTRATSLDDFFNKLPRWTPDGRTGIKASLKRRANGEKNVGVPTTGEKNMDGRSYNVNEQKVSLTESPEDLVMFTPGAATLYPGALLQETNMRKGLGSQLLIPELAGKRAPFKMTIAYGGGKQETVVDPSLGNVNDVVFKMRQALDKTNWTSSIIYKYGVAESKEAAALQLGLNVKYLTAGITAMYDNKSQLNQEVVNGYAVIPAYTIVMDPRASGWRGFFNEKFTLDDAKALAKGNFISPSNQPCYISDITYGSVVAFRAVRTLTAQEMSIKVREHGSIGFFQADASQEGRRITSSSDTQVTVIGIGIPGATAYAIPMSGPNFNEYMRKLGERTPSSLQLAPISYTVRSMKDGSIASLQSTTQYTNTIVVPNPIGERVKLRISFKILDASDGALNNDVECWATVRVNDRPIYTTDKFGKEKEVGIPRSEVVTKEKNQTLDLGEIPIEVLRANSNKKIQIELYDRDKGSQDDHMGSWLLNIDPTQLIGKAPLVQNGYEIKGGKKKLKSKLTIVVDHGEIF